MNVIYREADSRDSVGIARLSGQLGYPSNVDEIERRLRFITGCQDNVVYAAEIDGELVGWVHAHGRYLIESEPFIEIGGLVVDGEHRGAGIGKRLMNMCEEWAQASGFREMRVRSGGSRVEAHQFYRRIGYENIKMQQVFRKELVDSKQNNLRDGSNQTSH